MEVIRSAFEALKFKPSRASLIRLLEASQRLIYGVCYEVLRHREDSEDATQRVLLEIQKGLPEVVNAEHFLRRLRLVAFRTALDTRRDRRRRIDRERKAADMNPTAPLPEEVREAIHEAMSALDEDSRSLVMEHYFEKATLGEMGKRRGVSGAAVWKRIEDVKGRLRDGLTLAGLIAAASKAEACLESVSMAAPAANLVSGATIAGGGIMAVKTSTAAVAAIVAALTFALGLGGGLAIQAARDPEPFGLTPVTRNEPAPVFEDSVRTFQESPQRAPESTAVPASAPVESPEERLKLAREIWGQMSRYRFWKDRDAQDETLPKLKQLGPDLTAYFIDRFREEDLSRAQRGEAIRLAIACGGPLAADLVLELARATSNEARHQRVAAMAALQGGFTLPPAEFPVSQDLWAAALVLRTSDSGWDRVLSMTILTYGKREEWTPIVTELVRSDPESLARVEVVKLLAQRGDAGVLAFLRDQKTAISLVPFRFSEAWTEQERSKIGRCVDEAIENMERRLKK
ncbi:MAG TPA: sigma-70 family RNA polymerase sigma factor [Planctomycetota bacterium]|nr:sigma-70 family RNA polymerase sigma factor [Planctomycetota bacterium]